MCGCCSSDDGDQVPKQAQIKTKGDLKFSSGSLVGSKQGTITKDYKVLDPPI